MCRSIKLLRSEASQPAEDDVRAAALQYVRKISGYRQPSRVNAPAFEAAVEEIAVASARLLLALSENRCRPVETSLANG